ncbi:phosphoenolpyruvate-utilizing N-terminal domain-containing protein, partial [Metapseudomonas otitidis]|uniref:phosphoenolpyruvate-utilizing N-terminal domain-containing protein n=1 Tax=Metapseudomonas otitidis TaxID=319939 RepID=UPI0028124537
CLASLGDAHQALLERLCSLLVEGRGGEIVHAVSSRALLETLGGDSIADWPSLRVPLANAHGLHARPAKELAQAAKAFAGEIRIRVADSGQPAVSARSLSKLLALGVRRGQVLELLAEPAIADEALPALRDAILAGLGETVEPLDAARPEAPSEAPEAPVAEPNAPQPGEVLAAVSASPGIAIGPAHVRVARAFDYPARGESPAQERQRLEQALAQVRGEIEALVARSEVKAIREIFVTHLEMLADPSLVEDVDARLARGESAAAAWNAVIGEAARQQEALQDALLAERAADLRDVGRRVLAQLCGVEEVPEPREPYVLVLDEMAPSDVARLDRERVAGILTARGGATSHSAIVAR